MTTTYKPTERAQVLPLEAPKLRSLAEAHQDTPTCPRDGFPLEWVSGDFPTGVSMNGYHESRYGEGFLCEKCGTVFDESDVSDTEER